MLRDCHKCFWCHHLLAAKSWCSSVSFPLFYSFFVLFKRRKIWCSGHTWQMPMQYNKIGIERKLGCFVLPGCIFFSALQNYLLFVSPIIFRKIDFFFFARFPLVFFLFCAICVVQALCVRGCWGCQSVLQAQQLRAALGDSATPGSGSCTPHPSHSSCGTQCVLEGNLGWSPAAGLILDTDFSTARNFALKLTATPMFSWLSSLPVLTLARVSAGTARAPCSHCPLLRLADCSSPVGCSLLYLQGSTMLMQHRC